MIGRPKRILEDALEEEDRRKKKTKKRRSIDVLEPGKQRVFITTTVFYMALILHCFVSQLFQSRKTTLN